MSIVFEAKLNCMYAIFENLYAHTHKSSNNKYDSWERLETYS